MKRLNSHQVCPEGIPCETAEWPLGIPGGVASQMWMWRSRGLGSRTIRKRHAKYRLFRLELLTIWGRKYTDYMSRKWNNRRTGARYEQVAGAYLESQGYRILQYNYRCRQGEIDIVARDGEVLVFCEVKFRRDLSSGLPEEAVNYRKQRVISKCALHYLTVHGLSEVQCRFDVIGILGGGEDVEHSFSSIRLYKNAFDYRE